MDFRQPRQELQVIAVSVDCPVTLGFVAFRDTVDSVVYLVIRGSAVSVDIQVSVDYQDIVGFAA